MRRRTVFLDLDGTLIRTAPLYEEAKAVYAALVAQELGMGAAEVAEGFDRFDVGRTNAMGHQKTRFPESMGLYYATLCDSLFRLPDMRLYRRCRIVGARVFRRKAPLIPGAIELVATLRERYRVACYTLGDPQVQYRRLADVGLDGAFDDVIVTAAKDRPSLLRALAAQCCEPEDAVVVGDSPRSDIRPAIDAGLAGAVLVGDGAGAWSFDRDDFHGEFVRYAATLAAVPKAVAHCFLDHDYREEAS